MHGTTIDNERNIASGWSDVDLSKLGIRQSEELWSKIKDTKFDVVFCSDLRRAVHSAQLTFKNRVRIIQDKRLRECNYGRYNGGDGKEVDRLKDKMIDQKFPGGESYREVEARIGDFLRDIGKGYQGRSIAIVAHHAPQMALDVLLRGMSWQEAFSKDWRKTKSWQPGWEYYLE